MIRGILNIKDAPFLKSSLYDNTSKRKCRIRKRNRLYILINLNRNILNHYIDQPRYCSRSSYTNCAATFIRCVSLPPKLQNSKLWRNQK